MLNFHRTQLVESEGKCLINFNSSKIVMKQQAEIELLSKTSFSIARFQDLTSNFQI